MTKSAVIGYMIIAARASGVSEEVIQDMEWDIQTAMDEYTEHEAEEVFKNF